MSALMDMEEPLRAVMALSRLVRHAAMSDEHLEAVELAYLADGLDAAHKELRGLWQTSLDEQKAESATKPKPNPVNAAG